MKLTLLSLDLQVVSQEAFQDCSNVSDVILQGSRVDQDVFDIHDHLESEHVPEHLVNFTRVGGSIRNFDEKRPKLNCLLLRPRS